MNHNQSSRDIPAPGRDRLLIPGLAGLYASLGNLSETVLRAFAGIALITHGWSKIQAPMARIDLVESLGFYPGVIFSPLLSGTEFFGGILIAIGLLTRPAAVGALVVLLVAAWFHWVTQGEGYSGAEKALLWAAIMFFFAIRGGNRHSVDALLRKEI